MIVNTYSEWGRQYSCEYWVVPWYEPNGTDRTVVPSHRSLIVQLVSPAQSSVRTSTATIIPSQGGHSPNCETSECLTAPPDATSVPTTVTW